MWAVIALTRRGFCERMSYKLQGTLVRAEHVEELPLRTPYNLINHNVNHVGHSFITPQTHQSLPKVSMVRLAFTLPDLGSSFHVNYLYGTGADPQPTYHNRAQTRQQQTPPFQCKHPEAVLHWQT